TPVGVTVGPDQSFLLGWGRDDKTLQFQRFKNGDWLRGSDGTPNTGWRGLGGNLQAPPPPVAGPRHRIRGFARHARPAAPLSARTGTDIYWENGVPLDGDTVKPVGVSGRAGTAAGVIDAFGIDAATGQPFHTTIDGTPNAVQVIPNLEAFKVGDSAYYTVNG